ncbi:MAG TPA: hypothetical protein VKR56_00255 [Candidatus Cybelea sp.]|nr:hypothetical protein [Candidatus Cybelea sp.]
MKRRPGSTQHNARPLDSELVDKDGFVDLGLPNVCWPTSSPGTLLAAHRSKCVDNLELRVRGRLALADSNDLR